MQVASIRGAKPLLAGAQQQRKGAAALTAPRSRAVSIKAIAEPQVANVNSNGAAPSLAGWAPESWRTKTALQVRVRRAPVAAGAARRAAINAALPPPPAAVALHLHTLGDMEIALAVPAIQGARATASCRACTQRRGLALKAPRHEKTPAGAAALLPDAPLSRVRRLALPQPTTHQYHQHQHNHHPHTNQNEKKNSNPSTPTPRASPRRAARSSRTRR